MIYKTPVGKLTFTGVDIKTTGPYPYLGDKICEIGAVRFNLLSKHSEFSTLINPDTPLPRSTSYKTGIADEMLCDAPSFTEVKEEFLSFIGDTILVFHNAPFCLSFLSREVIKPVDNIVIDILIIARRKFIFKHNTLLYIAKKLKLNILPICRALEDARVISEVMKAFVETIHPTTLGDILSVQGGSIKIVCNTVFMGDKNTK
ncbi:3'-5' exonuclease [candidate division WOR-3 bacterium]|nr:3'-5' exonuclease [candidate division WOR-3 bacterium]